MANTVFFEKAKSMASSITWKDIFSDFCQKHTKRDMEYAFLAGTSLDYADESNMLGKWRKPWLFWRVLMSFAAIGALALATLIVNELTSGTIGAATVYFIYVIFSMAVPVSMMVLFWELNIPRNISIYELLGFFLVGALLSFCMTEVIRDFVSFPGTVIDAGLGKRDSWLGAPLREEPAKLAASVALLCWFSGKKKKIYGITGIVIGAAVGTGFSVFETITYAADYGVINLLVRVIFAIIGHTAYCAPYVGAIALHTEKSKLSLKSFQNSDFALTFICALVMHMFWNSALLKNLLLKAMIEFVVLWRIVLYILRKSMQQIVSAALGQSIQRDASVSGTPAVVGVSGCFAGRSFQLPPQGLSMGREPTNQIVFPPQSAGGISRKHCTVCYDPGIHAFILTDQNSSYGTFMENGVRLAAGKSVTLLPGERFYLASKAAMFCVTI